MPAPERRVVSGPPRAVPFLSSDNAMWPSSPSGRMRGEIRTLAAALLLGSVLAGCIGTTEPGLEEASVTIPSVEDVTAYAHARLVQDHDHAASHAEHAGSIGFAAAALAPGRAGTPPAGEVYSELAIKGGYAYLAFGPRACLLYTSDAADE